MPGYQPLPSCMYARLSEYIKLRNLCLTQGQDKTSILPMPWVATRKSSRSTVTNESRAMLSYLYQNTISRLSSGMGGVGPVGKHEARIWHRRAYAGLVR